MQKNEIKFNIALSLVKDKLEKGQEICSVIISDSMYPILEEGDSVIIKGIGSKGAGFSDIVIYYSGGYFCAHRYCYNLHGQRGKGSPMVTKGDNRHFFDRDAVDPEQVLGRIAIINKNTATIDMDRFYWRWINYIIWIVSCISGKVLSRVKSPRLRRLIMAPSAGFNMLMVKSFCLFSAK